MLPSAAPTPGLSARLCFIDLLFPASRSASTYSLEHHHQCRLTNKQQNMRFINTQTLQFVTVADSELGKDEKKYAILSHRWRAAEDEVLFTDVNGLQDFSHKQAFGKIKGFCDKAASLGYDYAWVDTCCIDKRDLNELTEAINKMYRWYQGSDLCIIYLADVDKTGMMDSSWWTRGWTLQELIAPKAASFYDCGWHLIGTKSGLLSEISTKTGIPESILTDPANLHTCSVAQRMSWAANRQTTREEDRAYSLLGIFGVYLPHIYGEGDNAFLRLQEAIRMKGKDESMFAWGMRIGNDHRRYTGLFAPSPDSYVNCGDIISTRGSTGFRVEHGELTITLKTLPHSMETYYAALSCTQRSCPDARICILVSRLSTQNEYVRVNKAYRNGKRLIASANLEDFRARTICIAVDPVEHPVEKTYGFWLRTIEPPGHSACQIRILSRNPSAEADKVYLNDQECGTAGIVSIEPEVEPEHDYRATQKEWSRIRWIMLGFDDDFNPMLLLAPAKRFYDQCRQLTDKSFEEAVASEARSQARGGIFDNEWISSGAGVPASSDESNRWPTGTSVLKVDNWKGVSGSIKALNLGITVYLAPEPSPFVRSEGVNHCQDRQIWVVDITNTGGPDLETKARSQSECLEWLWCLWAAANCGVTLSEQELEYRRLGVLTASELERLN